MSAIDSPRPRGQRLHIACERLLGTRGIANAARNTARWLPHDSSPAQHDRDAAAAAGDEDNSVRVDLLDGGLQLAAMRLDATEQHLSVLAHMLPAGDYPAVAPSIARVAIEVAARAHWLLEPDLSLHIRLARFVAEEHDSLLRIRGLRLVNESAQAAADVKRLDDKVNAAGLGKREAVPHVERLVDDIYNTHDADAGRLVYGLLSAYSHGTSYGLEEFLYPAVAPFGAALQLRGDVSTDALVLHMVVHAYRRAVRRQMTYDGWNASPLERHLASVLSAVSHPPAELTRNRSTSRRTRVSAQSCSYVPRRQPPQPHTVHCDS